MRHDRAVGDEGPPDGAAVAAAYDLGRPLSEPVFAGRGQVGVIWRLDTDRGSYAVKPQPGIDEAAAGAAQARIAALCAEGVSTPRARRAGDGRLVVAVRGMDVRVYDWADLAEPDPGLDPAAVGALLGRLHRVPIPVSGQVDDWFVAPVSPPRWRDLAAALARARAPFADEFAESVPVFIDLQRFFVAPGRLQWCHRDLWADNVRRTPDGGLTVIDWDNAGPESAVQELCCLLAEFAYGNADRAHALGAAYLAEGGPGLPTGPGDFTMAAAQFGHFAESAAQRWLDAGTDDARGRAEAWFREGYDRPLDRAGIDLLLEALAGPPGVTGR